MANDKCMKCDKPFAYKFTKIIKGQVHDLLLCEEHAQQFSPYLKNKTIDQSKLLELFQHFLKEQGKTQIGAAHQGGSEIGDESKCSNCGLAYGAYRKTLLLGCSDCYDSFKDLILNDLRKIHGSVSHESAATASSPPPRQEKPFLPSFQGEMAMPIPPDASDARGSKNSKTTDLSPGEVISIMENKMQEAIKREDFKLAANLRDSIRQRKGDDI